MSIENINKYDTLADVVRELQETHAATIDMNDGVIIDPASKQMKAVDVKLDGESIEFPQRAFTENPISRRRAEALKEYEFKVKTKNSARPVQVPVKVHSSPLLKFKPPRQALERAEAEEDLRRMAEHITQSSERIKNQQAHVYTHDEEQRFGAIRDNPPEDLTITELRELLLDRGFYPIMQYDLEVENSRERISNAAAKMNLLKKRSELTESEAKLLNSLPPSVRWKQYTD